MVRGRPPVYWHVYVARWMDRAFVCRYGSQNIYDILGRDPRAQPLSSLELAVFTACLQEHVMEERKPFDDLGLPPPDKNG